MNKLLQKKQKSKIGFLSTVIFVISSSIGAGIFLKDNEILNNTQGSFLFSMIAWIVALFGILALSLCLIEVTSGATSSNTEGFVGWVKDFNNHYLYVGCRIFMAYCYLPIAMFSMPYYAVDTFFAAIIGADYSIYIHWYWVALISFVIMVWFIISSALNVKVANIQSIVAFVAKLFPLIVAAVIGFIYISVNGTSNTNTILPSPDKPEQPLFTQLAPVLGIFMSIPSILFVVDGFYSATAIQSKMQEPKKIGKALVVGLVFIMLVDLIIAVSLLLGAKGTAGFSAFAQFLGNGAFYKIINILIAIGILGILNGFALHAHLTYKQLYSEGYLPFAKKIKTRQDQIEKVACCYSLVINVIGFLLATLIGIFFINSSFYDYNDSKLNNLLSFVDTSANWTVLLAFVIIAIVIVGCWINRKTKKLPVTKFKYFKPAAIICVSFIAMSYGLLFVSSIADIGLAAKYTAQHKYTNEEIVNQLVGSIIKLIVLLTMTILLFVSPLWSKQYKNKEKNIYVDDEQKTKVIVG